MSKWLRCVIAVCAATLVLACDYGMLHRSMASPLPTIQPTTMTVTIPPDNRAEGVRAGSALPRLAAGGASSYAEVTDQIKNAGPNAITLSNKPDTNDERKIIYNGTLRMRFANREAARTSIEEIVARHKGQISLSMFTEMTIRIAPDDFKAAMNDIASLGEVVDREIKSEDVTAQYVDLNIRMEVAEKSRQRVMELLGKAAQLKDELEAEHEIRRLTEEIEGMKGQMRVLLSQTQLATIVVHLDEKVVAPAPPRKHSGSNFEWIDDIGIERATRQVPADSTLDGEPWLRRSILGPRFQLATINGSELPQGFVPILHTPWEMIGATADDDRLRITYHPLRKQQGGDIDFWIKALTDELKTWRGYAMDAPESFQLNDKSLDGQMLRGHTMDANEAYAYDVWVVMEPGDADHLVVVELARKQNDGNDSPLEAMNKAVAGMKVR